MSRLISPVAYISLNDSHKMFTVSDWCIQVSMPHVLDAAMFIHIWRWIEMQSLGWVGHFKKRMLKWDWMLSCNRILDLNSMLQLSCPFIHWLYQFADHNIWTLDILAKFWPKIARWTIKRAICMVHFHCGAVPIDYVTLSLVVMVSNCCVCSP